MAIGPIQTEADLRNFVRREIGAEPALVRQLQEAATGLESGKQPLDPDLTAIAALNTTSHGRGLLTGADAAATRTAIGTDAAGAQRPPQGPETNLKIIRGIVASAGGISEGSGFTVTKGSTGLYTINFTAAFSDQPAVICTSTHAGISVATTGVSTTTASIEQRVYTTNTVADQGFHFQAIGPA